MDLSGGVRQPLFHRAGLSTADAAARPFSADIDEAGKATVTRSPAKRETRPGLTAVHVTGRSRVCGHCELSGNGVGRIRRRV